MKRTTLLLLFLLPFFTNCKKQKPPSPPATSPGSSQGPQPLCPSSSFCVLSKMPLLNQGASSLPPIIAEKTGDSSITKDKGWCAPVSSTIGIAGLVRETPSSVKFNNGFDQFRSFGTYYTSTSRTKKYGPSIYKVGQEMQTNWKNGGTYSSRKVDAFEKFTKDIKAPSNYQVGHKDQSLSRWTTVTNQDIINIFKTRKPAFAVSWGVYKKSDGGSIYRRTGGHALIINGYEDGYLKVYDPWGKIYNVNIVEAEGSGIYGRAEVRHVSGSRGFVQAYSGASKKVIFDGYNYMYTHRE